MSFKLAQHLCGESALKCADCNAQICPKCLVECPVGIRCKQCGKGSAVKRRPVKLEIKKGVGFFAFGSLYGWLIEYANGGGLSFCFYIAFWVAGREVGSQLRRQQKELLVSWAIPFISGMALGAAALFFLTGAQTLIPIAINLGVMLFGFVIGRCGLFGCR